MRNAYAVLADFQAFERFKVINSGPRSTPWSRGREDELQSILTSELGAAVVAKLQLLAFLIRPAQFLEDECVKAITQALLEMGDRDAPETGPPDGWLVI